MRKNMRVLVTGAGGFIGHHLVRQLKADGYGFAVWTLNILSSKLHSLTSSKFWTCANGKIVYEAIHGVDQVYNLAADMGGIGYITAYLANIARNNTLINMHMLEASRVGGVKKFLFSSSACVYAQSKQRSADVTPLKEEDAHPAEPEPGYGWEKLFAEQVCGYYTKDYKLDTRIVRFHNVYGPLGTFEGGKEKAPAAISRKVALAPEGSEIQVWGDGQQTRSFMYVDDCVEGLMRLMASDYREPLNLGTDELISVDGLVDLISKIAGKT